MCFVHYNITLLSFSGRVSPPSLTEQSGATASTSYRYKSFVVCVSIERIMLRSTYCGLGLVDSDSESENDERQLQEAIQNSISDISHQ